MEDKRAVHSSVWSPLLVPIFRALWIASLVANLGVWMQNVNGVWLMTTLSSSPVLIALMQTATSLPVVLLRNRDGGGTRGGSRVANAGERGIGYDSGVGPWVEPHVPIEERPVGVPVLVTVEYRIDPQQAPSFLKAMRDLQRV